MDGQRDFPGKFALQVSPSGFLQDSLLSGNLPACRFLHGGSRLVSFRELWQSLCFVPASGLFFQVNLKDFLFLSFHPLFD